MNVPPGSLETLPSTFSTSGIQTPDKESDMRNSAKEFEAVFIREMLSHAGLDKALSQNSGFGGEAFSTMLLDSYAEQIANKGGFGLAEVIYKQLRSRMS